MNEVQPGGIENLAPWGAVIGWNDMPVLAYNGPGGWWFLTDISDMPNWRANFQPYYNPMAGWAIWHIPQETAARIVEVAKQAAGGLELGLAYGPLVFAAVAAAFLFRK